MAGFIRVCSIETFFVGSILFTWNIYIFLSPIYREFFRDNVDYESNAFLVQSFQLP